MTLQGGARLTTVRLADPEVTGQLIADYAYRAQWVSLVQALQLASAEGGPLEGWVFHGTDEEAAASIDVFGLQASLAIVNTSYDANVETEGCHFGTANVAAFFAEDLIESKEDGSLRFVIYGARLAALAEWGELAVDMQMADVPLVSRYQRDSDGLSAFLDAGQGWRASLEHLESVVVLSDVPRQMLTKFAVSTDVPASMTENRCPA